MSYESSDIELQWVNKLLPSERIRERPESSLSQDSMTGNSGPLPEPARSTLRWHSFLSRVNYGQEFYLPWTSTVIRIPTLISSSPYPLPDFLNPDAASQVARYLGFCCCCLPSRRWLEESGWGLSNSCSSSQENPRSLWLLTVCKVCPGCNKNHIFKSFHWALPLCEQGPDFPIFA